jgi:hypothetical protein
MTVKKIYLAGNYESHPEMRQWRKTIGESGHFVTSRWINGTHESQEGTDDYVANQSFAQEDYQDLQAADVAIFDSRSHQHGTSRGGRHVEFGLALAWDKEIFLIGSPECVFHYLPQVYRVESLEDVLDMLSTRTLS